MFHIFISCMLSFHLKEIQIGVAVYANGIDDIKKFMTK